MVISAIASQKQAMLTPTRRTMIKMRFTRCSRVGGRRAYAGQIGAGRSFSCDHHALPSQGRHDIIHGRT